MNNTSYADLAVESVAYRLSTSLERKLDEKFGLIDKKFDQMEKQFDRKFESLDMKIGVLSDKVATLSIVYTFLAGSFGSMFILLVKEFLDKK